MIKYLLSIFFFIFFINSCSISKNIEKTFIKIKKNNLFTNKSNFIILNFDFAVEKIILDMLKSNNISIFNNTSFFINILENHTNFFVDEEQLTNLIKNKIYKQNNKIHFIENKKIEKDKKKLGISNIKSSIDTSTAILLSRNNNVKYYLHSSISGKNQPFLLKIKLILVKTGEMVFLKTEEFY